MKSLFYLLLFTLFISNKILAQGHYGVSGIVADEKGQPVKSATVFISGTEKITMTDDAGRFLFHKIDAGTFTVSVSMVGYFPYAQNIIIKENAVNVSIILKLKTIVLAEVVIGGKVSAWATNYEVFKKAFLGTSANGRQCVILNPSIINFTTKNGALLADADEFLIIENKRLGYKIKYLLKDFSYTYDAKLSLYTGESVFEEMQGPEQLKKEWAKNRADTYKGSQMHFLRSVFSDNLLSEGFVTRQLFALVTLKEDNKIKYLNRAFIDPGQVNLDTLVAGIDTSFKSLKFTTLYVLYDKKEAARLKGSPVTGKNPQNIELDNDRGTIIKLQASEAIIDRKGSYTNYKAFYVVGGFAKRRVGDQLPVEYQPQ
jgi:hypothetical protein